MRIFDFDPALRAVSQFLNTTNNRYEGVALITKLERLDFEASDFSPAATKSVLRTDSGSLVLSPEHAKQLDELNLRTQRHSHKPAQQTNEES